jgi:HK97 family phage major capsid protein
MPKFLLRLDIQFFASSDDKAFSADSLKKLQEDFTTQWGELKTLLDTQADEMRTHGETTTQTASSIKSVETKIGSLENDLKGATQQIKEFEAKFNRPDFGGKPVYQTAGERFVESDAYKNMVASGSNGSQPFEVGSFFKMFQKDLNSTDPKGGILVAPQVAGGIVSPMDQQLRMRDILNVQGTTSNAIEYIQKLDLQTLQRQSQRKRYHLNQISLSIQ